MKRSDYIGSKRHKENCRIASNKAREVNRIKAAIRRTRLKQEYNKNQKKCNFCGKELPFEKRFSNYCNNSCSAKSSNKKRLENGYKIPSGTKQCLCSKCEVEFVNINIYSSAKKAICKTCLIKTKYKKCEFNNCNKFVKITNKTPYCKEHVQKSEEYRIKASLITKKLHKEGKLKGWPHRNKFVASYAEQYFIDLLTNENIPFRREVKIGKYFADFLLDNNIILEIDGKQHTYDNRPQLDIEKDRFLIENGYKVFRIKWVNPINDNNKQILYKQIINFKEFLDNN